MPAFTFLAQKVNISIFSDTITLYPKSAHADEIMDDIVCRINLQTLSSGTNSIGHSGYIHRQDPSHGQCHQDHFDIEQTHRHLKINSVIDIPELSSILALLADEGLINEEEKLNCLKEFIRATIFEPEEARAKEANSKHATAEKDEVVNITDAINLMFFAPRPAQQYSFTPSATSSRLM